MKKDFSFAGTSPALRFAPDRLLPDSATCAIAAASTHTSATPDCPPYPDWPPCPEIPAPTPDAHPDEDNALVPAPHSPPTLNEEQRLERLARLWVSCALPRLRERLTEQIGDSWDESPA